MLPFVSLAIETNGGLENIAQPGCVSIQTIGPAIFGFEIGIGHGCLDGGDEIIRMDRALLFEDGKGDPAALVNELARTMQSFSLWSPALIAQACANGGCADELLTPDLEEWQASLAGGLGNRGEGDACFMGCIAKAQPRSPERQRLLRLGDGKGFGVAVHRDPAATVGARVAGGDEDFVIFDGAMVRDSIAYSSSCFARRLLGGGRMMVRGRGLRQECRIEQAVIRAA
jgi:hypothetical protein